MTQQIEPMFEVLKKIGAVKIRTVSYDEASMLRTQVNTELRRQGIKEEFTTSIMPSGNSHLLLVWRTSFFGKKGARDIVAKLTDITELVDTVPPEEDWIDERSEEILKHLKEIKAKKKESNINKLVELLGKE